MKKILWEILTKILSNNEEENINQAISLLIPYIKICSKNNYKKAKMYSLVIPYEDFYSNSLLEVWEGLKAYVKNNNLNLKNVVIYRISIAERKTWNQYKKRGNNTDTNEITYNTVRWSEIDFEIKEDMNFENYLVGKESFIKSLYIFQKTDQNKADIIRLLVRGYSSKEAFNIVYKTNEYRPKDRKKIERIRKQFLEIYQSN